jgi:5-methylcytosine-specific restriction endonuclease McrA
VLNAKVLLLNQSYEPLTLCTTKKALILIVLQKAELIKNNSKLSIRTVNKSFPWPSVIRLKSYIKVPYNNINLTRKNILRRDNHKCAYCGRGDLAFTMDHVIPKAKGGKDSWENLVTACLPCNNKKGSKTLEEANMQLKIKPFKPNYIMFILNSVSRIDDTWRPYLFQ